MLNQDRPSSWRICCAIAAVFLLLGGLRVQAIILFRTGDPGANTTAPTGDLLDSGWQYQGIWGAFTGTPIAPHYFISAQHIGPQGTIHFNGLNYAVTGEFNDPQTDLKILRVGDAFPFFAPLYSRADEIGKHIVEFGRGTQRGAEVTLNGASKGWSWGTEDHLLRWGENMVTGAPTAGPDSGYLVSAFDQVGLPNECHLSKGDSGGAAFIQDNGTWKLAGINYGVDGPFYTDAAKSGEFFAALFDQRGFYDGDGVHITGSSPVPSSFYPTRISQRLPWIASVIATPTIGHEPGFATVTYSKFVLPETDLVYVVEQSSDLVAWSTASKTDTTVTVTGSVETVTSRVAIGSANRLFLRLRISRP